MSQLAKCLVGLYITVLQFVFTISGVHSIKLHVLATAEVWRMAGSLLIPYKLFIFMTRCSKGCLQNFESLNSENCIWSGLRNLLVINHTSEWIGEYWFKSIQVVVSIPKALKYSQAVKSWKPLKVLIIFFFNFILKVWVFYKMERSQLLWVRIIYRKCSVVINWDHVLQSSRVV